MWVVLKQAYGNSVFAVIYGVLGDVGSVVGLLGQVEDIINVDVNITDISADLTVRQAASPCGTLCAQPAGHSACHTWWHPSST